MFIRVGICEGAARDWVGPCRLYRGLCILAPLGPVSLVGVCCLMYTYLAMALWGGL